MKQMLIAAGLVITLLTTGQPVSAQEGQSTIKMDDVGEGQFTEYDLNLNPQLGYSSFEYSRRKPQTGQGLTGGLTVELGQSLRKLETGLIVMEMAESRYLSIPMMAKLRVHAMRTQSWYAKVGFISAFEVAGGTESSTKFDILGALGVGGRVVVDRSKDFIIEATYNRGLLPSGTDTGVYNQGFLILAGLSFRI